MHAGMARRRRLLSHAGKADRLAGYVHAHTCMSVKVWVKIGTSRKGIIVNTTDNSN